MVENVTSQIFFPLCMAILTMPFQDLCHDTEEAYLLCKLFVVFSVYLWCF